MLDESAHHSVREVFMKKLSENCDGFVDEILLNLYS